MGDEDLLRGLEIPTGELILEFLIGSGYTSEVYKGLWTRHDNTVVAIKQITEDAQMRSEQQLAFVREMSVLTQVRHENLVQLYGVCLDSRPLRIVTEYCGGGAVFELLHNSPIDLVYPQQIKMCRDVARAMNYLHTFNPMIIHRDLKSLNLLLDKPVTGLDLPLVKVCDFGVAKFQVQAGNWGQMTNQAGTKHWMAPEMWTGSTYDEKVDVFSYAMVIYEIICREVPFEEEEPADVGKYTVAGIRPDMDAVPPDCLTRPALLLLGALVGLSISPAVQELVSRAEVLWGHAFTPSRAWGKGREVAVARAAVADCTTVQELDDAIANTAKGEPNVLIVGFSTTWCGPCKLMDPKVKELSETFEGRATFLKVMGDKDPESMQIMKREQVRTVPLYQIYKDGQKVGSVSGADADRLTSKIEQHTGMKATEPSNS
ncbi:unnamed protein product [Effrenium voratum]|nr:unnamed protein product [Effrenium voratum]